jgi:Homeodomain-like domain
VAIRKVLEARCRSPVTLQREFETGADCPAGGGGTQHAVDCQRCVVQPRIVSLWRHRYAEQGLEGLEDKPRPGKKPVYTEATDKRILALLDKPPRPPGAMMALCVRIG